MIKTRMLAPIIGLLLAVVTVGYCQTLEQNWGDFVHFTAIGRFDLAEDFAQLIIDGNPDPKQLLALSQSNPRGYSILVRVNKNRQDLAEVTGKILDIIERGRLIRRRDPKIITEEIRRLSSTPRGRVTAVKRLRSAGEYAIPYILDAIADPAREGELPNITAAIPKIGRDAIRPLVAALQTAEVAVKAEIIRAIGKLGYSQSLAYLKYIIENDKSAQLRDLARHSVRQIDPAVLKLPAAEMFFKLAESYYYRSESLSPAGDADFANIWFWDKADRRLERREVDRSYFYELMAMRCCEWALKADPNTGKAIALWLAAFFKAESTGLAQPEYFGRVHADALTYATTAGPEYLHQALARAVKDKDAQVALGLVEALGTTAGEKSLLFRLGTEQPLVDALSFDDRAVRYSAAIAIAAAGPTNGFRESVLVIENLADAVRADGKEGWEAQLIDFYAVRAVKVMLQLAQSRNAVIDLSRAQDVLIEATKDKRAEIQKLTARILAHLPSPGAQRAIAAMAINQANALHIRISAFNSLAISAKLNAGLLDDEKIDAVYLLIKSDTAEPQLRSVAAAAYGALNLPSRKVKDLILDQSKS